jgi:hypothetical protein
MGLELTYPSSEQFDEAYLKALYHTSEVYTFVKEHKKILPKTSQML